MSIKVYLSAVSLMAPGLDGWQQSQAVLSGAQSYIKEALPNIAPAILPANERRRTTALIKLALQVAEQCIGADLSIAQQYATVFASSDGDHGILDKICRALCEPERPVSPTNFHNSVHNAPAGYWAIAANAQLNSNSLSACNETFAAGFLEAATFALIEQKPVLFVAYDMPAPSPLDAARHLDAAFGVGMCLSGTKEPNCFAELELELDSRKFDSLAEAEYSDCEDKALEQLRQGNPAARALPLLQALATKNAAITRVVIPHVQSTLLVINVNSF